MLIFDRLRTTPSSATKDTSTTTSNNISESLESTTIIDGTILPLNPSEIDAYSILHDLCFLIGKSTSYHPGGASSSSINTGEGGSSTTPTSSGYGISSLWGGNKSGGKREEARMLKLNGLGKTFGLELVESILSGFEDGVKEVGFRKRALTGFCVW